MSHLGDNAEGYNRGFDLPGEGGSGEVEGGEDVHCSRIRRREWFFKLNRL